MTKFRRYFKEDSKDHAMNKLETSVEEIIDSIVKVSLDENDTYFEAYTFLRELKFGPLSDAEQEILNLAIRKIRDTALRNPVVRDE